MNTIVPLGPYAMTWSRLLLIGGTAQLVVFALINIALPSLIRVERMLLASSVLFLGAWFVAFDAQSLIRSFNKTPQLQASAIARTKSGSCVVVTRDMKASDVRSRLGEPDERRSDDETRGPGATIWIYRDSRCAVHLFDDKVEFIE